MMAVKLFLIAAAATLLVWSCEARYVMDNEDSMIRDDTESSWLRSGRMAKRQPLQLDDIKVIQDMPHMTTRNSEEMDRKAIWTPKFRHDDEDEIMEPRQKMNRQVLRGEQQTRQVNSQEDMLNTIYKDN